MPEAGKDNIGQVKRGFADLLAFLFDVDIVCINQADIGKKTDQVGIMGDLYGIATSVIVFLSEESDDSDLAIDFAEKASIVIVRGTLRTSRQATPIRGGHLTTFPYILILTRLLYRIKHIYFINCIFHYISRTPNAPPLSTAP
jgi:Heterokaryon incompatibility protein (HET)